MHLTIVSLEKEIFSQEIAFVVLEAQDGQLGIYPKHANLLSVLKPGLVKAHLIGNQTPEMFFIFGGILEVFDNKVCVLADSVCHSDEIGGQLELEQELSLKEKQDYNIDLFYKNGMFYNDVQVLLAKMEAVRLINKKY